MIESPAAMSTAEQSMMSIPQLHHPGAIPKTISMSQFRGMSESSSGEMDYKLQVRDQSPIRPSRIMKDPFVRAAKALLDSDEEADDNLNHETSMDIYTMLEQDISKMNFNQIRQQQKVPEREVNDPFAVVLNRRMPKNNPDPWVRSRLIRFPALRKDHTQFYDVMAAFKPSQHIGLGAASLKSTVPRFKAKPKETEPVVPAITRLLKKKEQSKATWIERIAKDLHRKLPALDADMCGLGMMSMREISTSLVAKQENLIGMYRPPSKALVISDESLNLVLTLSKEGKSLLRYAQLAD